MITINASVLRFFLSLFLGGCVMGCTAPQLLHPSEKVTLPDRYDTQTDTVNMAEWPRHTFFSDTLLVNLIDEAVANNFDARMAWQRIEQAKASVLFAKGLLAPAVYAGGGAAVRRYGLYTMDGAGNATTDIEPGKIVPVNLPDFLVGLQSSWEADITGKLRNRKKAASARLLASVEGRHWLVSHIVSEVAAAYYELLSLDRELDIIRSTIQLQENALAVVTAQKENGSANELVVNQFTAQVLNTKALEYDVRQAITETENRLNVLLGRVPRPIGRNAATFETALADSLLAGVPAALLRNRPDIRQAELEVIASKADVRAARAAFYPSLNITASVGFQSYATRLLFSSPESFVFTLVGGLYAPLVNRSAIKAEFQAANAYQTQALYHYQKTTVTAYAEVYNELTRMTNLGRALQYKEQEAEALTRAIDVANDLYLTGRATYLEVLMTQQNALDARLDWVVSRREQFINAIQLYKVLGGGWK